MASVLKNEELESFRQTLQGLRSRLRGDLDQMTDEALRRDNAGGSGNLSNVPLHMADLGTENYDQEFTLGLIENEQGTLELVNEALSRMDNGNIRPLRGMRRADLQATAPGAPLHAALHSVCTEAGGWRMKDERASAVSAAGSSSGRSPLGGAAFDLATKSLVFARIGPPPASPGRARSRTSSSCTPATTPGALWGFGAQPARTAA